MHAAIIVKEEVMDLWGSVGRVGEERGKRERESNAEELLI